jgi:hypothetical protein
MELNEKKPRLKLRFQETKILISKMNFHMSLRGKCVELIFCIVNEMDKNYFLFLMIYKQTTLSLGIISFSSTSEERNFG